VAHSLNNLRPARGGSKNLRREQTLKAWLGIGRLLVHIKKVQRNVRINLQN
jgi:hypothetical protein